MRKNGKTFSQVGRQEFAEDGAYRKSLANDIDFKTVNAVAAYLVDYLDRKINVIAVINPIVETSETTVVAVRLWPFANPASSLSVALSACDFQTTAEYAPG